MTNYAEHVEFKPSGIAAPLIFMFLFVVFVYGILFIGLMGVSNTIIHHYNLTAFLQYGNFGAFLGVICILAAWAAVVFSLAAIPYFILRSRGDDKKARLVGQVIIILMFHVFTIPFIILWPMVRNSSPALRARRVAKLRRKLMAQQAKTHGARA